MSNKLLNRVVFEKQYTRFSIFKTVCNNVIFMLSYFSNYSNVNSNGDDDNSNEVLKA